MSKKIVVGLLGIVLTFVFVMPVFAAESGETDSELKGLKGALKVTPNFLQYTEYKMLKLKKGFTNKYDDNALIPADFYDSDYQITPRGASPLSLEFTGGRQKTGAYGEFGETINILTGAKAVDESLQLGSIGVNNDFGFTIEPKEDLNKEIDVSEIKSLEIESHPWQEMIGDKKIEVPKIFELVPDDYFVAYFRDLQKFTELEDTIKNLSKPFERIFSLKGTVDFKNKIFQRLGISDIKVLREFIDEMALVSYDLDAYPNTDYALILKIKNDVLEKFVEDFVKTTDSQHGAVGDYYVIATDESTFELINGLQKDRSSSMADNLDLKYTLSVLESNYDGFVYFSEDFVKKLTSPVYRINARRRNTILKAMETLQYTVFAYRNITGEWPKSIQQIINEGYLAENSVADIGSYKVNDEGMVVHDVWNTIYDVTPLDRIEVDKVKVAEKNGYESFAEGYQNYWVEFIDPIGVAILVGDEIRFHTIILPLIEESDYKWLKSIVGESPVSFDFVKNPAIAPSLQLISKLDIEEVFYMIYQENPGEFGISKEYEECRDDYYDKYEKNGFISLRVTMEETCLKFEESKQKAVELVNKKINESIKWEKDRGILDFIGNEITFATGDSFEFKLNDFTMFDLFIGLELKDSKLARDFIDHLFKWLINDAFGGGGSRGMFGLKVDEPIRNEYKGKEFYMIPTGFINIFYMFLDDRLYFTVSQIAINNLIDASEESVSWDSSMSRLFDYLGDEQHVMAVMDFERLKKWLNGFILSDENFLGSSEFEQNLVYYTEALALAKNLPDYEGDVENVGQYYRFIPEEWFDAELVAEESVPYVEIGDEKFDMREVERDSYRFYGNSGVSRKYKLKDLTGKFDADEIVKEWQEFKNVGVATRFTKEGLDINLAFDNLENDELDSRIEVKGVTIADKGGDWLIWIAIGGFGVVLVLGVFFLTKKKDEVGGDQNLNS